MKTGWAALLYLSSLSPVSLDVKYKSDSLESCLSGSGVLTHPLCFGADLLNHVFSGQNVDSLSVLCPFPVIPGVAQQSQRWRPGPVFGVRVLRSSSPSRAECLPSWDRAGSSQPKQQDVLSPRSHGTRWEEVNSDMGEGERWGKDTLGGSQFP